MWFWFLCLVIIIGFASLVAGCVRNAVILERQSRTPASVLSYTLDDPNPAAVSQPTFRQQDISVDFSLVIPCYNEAKRITRTLETTKQYFDSLRDGQGHPLTYEVVVIDDGSQDDTIETVQHFAKYFESEKIFRLFKLERNCGKGVAVKEGLLRTRGALCLFLDADGATEISECQSLMEKLLHLLNLTRGEKFDRDHLRQLADSPAIVVGSRAHLQAKAIAHRSPIRNFLMHGFHLLVWVATRTPIRDTQCGFKLLTRAAVNRIFPHVKIRRWCFDVEVLFLAKRHRIPVGEVPVRWHEIPGSKVRMHHIFHMAWELGTIFFGYILLPSWKKGKGE